MQWSKVVKNQTGGTIPGIATYVHTSTLMMLCTFVKGLKVTCEFLKLTYYVIPISVLDHLIVILIAGSARLH